MATVFEARIIGNVGKDAISKKMESGIIAINFPVAHNENWKDKKTNEQRTRTTWINCTIWKKELANQSIVAYLKKGTLVEIYGTPIAKGFLDENGEIRTEIRLNVTKTNLLRLVHPSNEQGTTPIEDNSLQTDFDSISNFTLNDDDF